MKTLHFLLGAMLLLLTACGPEAMQPTISFEKTAYALTKGSIEVKLVVNNTDLSKLSSPVTVPVTVGGTAQKDADYTISAEKFTLGGASQSLVITITAKDNYDGNKTITLALGAVSGYGQGEAPATTVSLGKKGMMLYSFVKKNVTMSAGATVEFELRNQDGSAYVAEEEITIPISVDKEKSTAEEGKQFAFDGSPQVVIPIGKDRGMVKLKLIAPVVDAKNKIVLKTDLETKKGFVKGQYVESIITIFGSYGDKIFGTWVMDKFVTDKEAMDATWDGSATFTEANGFPVFNAEDKITIGDDGFTTSFKSSFKNYFQAQSDMTLKGELELRTGVGGRVTLQLVEINNVNRYFSDKETSEDKTALLGVRITEEGLLDVYVIDYYSKSFAPEFAESGMYQSTKPMATMSGVFLNFTMKKAG